MCRYCTEHRSTLVESDCVPMILHCIGTSSWNEFWTNHRSKAGYYLRYRVKQNQWLNVLNRRDDSGWDGHSCPCSIFRSSRIYHCPGPADHSKSGVERWAMCVERCGNIDVPQLPTGHGPVCRCRRVSSLVLKGQKSSHRRSDCLLEASAWGCMAETCQLITCMMTFSERSS